MLSVFFLSLSLYVSIHLSSLCSFHHPPFTAFHSYMCTPWESILSTPQPNQTSELRVFTLKTVAISCFIVAMWTQCSEGSLENLVPLEHGECGDAG